MQTHDWQVIVQEYGPLVWQTAYRLLAHHADAADCFQETFLTALELSRRQEVRNLPGLLVRLATTRAIDRLRQNGRRRRTDACNEEPIDCNADPIDAIEAQDLADRLREAIAELPPHEAQVFCLRHLGQMSYRQIARELHVGVGAVGVSLHRAKARLRESLGATIASDEVSHGQKK